MVRNAGGYFLGLGGCGGFSEFWGGVQTQGGWGIGGFKYDVGKLQVWYM